MKDCERERDESANPSRGRARTAQATTIVLLAVGLLTAIFVLQNTENTRIEFLFWSALVPLAGALLLAVALGGVLAFLVAITRARQFKRALRRRGDMLGQPDPSLRDSYSQRDTPRSHQVARLNSDNSSRARFVRFQPG